MKRKTILIMVIMLTFLFGNVIEAKPKAQRSKMMRHSGFGLKMAENNLFPARMLLNFKQDIGLSEKQVKKIEKMEFNFQGFMIKSSADAKLIGLQIKAELKAEKVNRGKVTSLIKKVASVKTEMQINKINYLLDVKSVLTKEQINKIDALKSERRKNRKSRMGQKKGKRMTGQRNNRGNRF